MTTTRGLRRADSYLLPTLIDRLRDDAPHRQTEVPGEYAVTRAQLRDIIQRDLAYLLNATNLGDLIDPQRYPHVAGSTVNFGVPPLTGAFMATRQWSDIEQTIKQAILTFEPRLVPASIRVVPRSDNDRKGRHGQVAFEIHGFIRTEPYPLEFMVQSSLDLETSRLHAHTSRA
ncbi:type VI secretion system baseplate subunit TssE [Caballeronia ptereochthonis]|uniref:Type VI secretion system lysozyme-like protein n=1 Tax=Caballeronia ptereochthonis TaxID=1777144 RepID=A0A158DRJ9_9BURK|nr:type VI secretion system baseplate subunit TssE [Caballeronia ptereochthonis]SAK96357.1 type VI secretion system lysozyme-like protein [Caballeronia ptereochthonis]